MTSGHKQSGLIKLLSLIIFTIIILSILKIDLRGLLDSETMRTNFTFAWEMVKSALATVKNWWFTYAYGPLTALGDYLMSLWQKVISLWPKG
ncbi:MAG: hypothetical protein WDZ85_02025 [Candidatus Paceibacterota bacterium]